jgi:hypothetical protein
MCSKHKDGAREPRSSRAERQAGSALPETSSPLATFLTLQRTIPLINRACRVAKPALEARGPR